MLAVEILEGVLELLAALVGRSPADDTLPRHSLDNTPLSASEAQMASAIQKRKRISAEAAEDFVKWLRTHPK